MLAVYKRTKSVALLLFTLLILVFVCTYAFTSTDTKKEILFVVKDEYYNKVNEENSHMGDVEILKYSELKDKNVSPYSAVAIPNDVKISSSEFFQYYKNGIRVYIYGDLSEEEYRKKLLISNDIAVDIKSFGEQFIVKPSVLSVYDTSFNERKFNLIAFKAGNYRPLLCDIDGDEMALATSALTGVWEDFRFVVKGKSESKYSQNPYYMHLFDGGQSMIRMESTIKREYSSESYKSFNFVYDLKVYMKSKKAIDTYRLAYQLTGDSVIESVFPKTFFMLPFTSKTLELQTDNSDVERYVLSDAVNVTNSIDDKRMVSQWQLSAVDFIPRDLNAFELKFQSKLSTNEKELNLTVDANAVVIDGVNRQYRIHTDNDKKVVYSYEF